MKKFLEKIIEGILTCSGFVTSITILLIVLFLFTEAFGLFRSKVIEEGYALALNKSNKVGVLSPAQIKKVFDGVGKISLSGFFVWRILHNIIRRRNSELPMSMREIR